MNVIKYLRKAGYDTVSGEFYGKIYEWQSWYEAMSDIFTGIEFIMVRTQSTAGV